MNVIIEIHFNLTKLTKNGSQNLTIECNKRMNYYVFLFYQSTFLTDKYKYILSMKY